MNVVDSSGWLEYFADGPNADFFAPAIEATTELIVPAISVYEVFKRVLQQRSESEALQAVAVMFRGHVVDFDVQPTAARSAERCGGLPPACRPCSLRLRRPNKRLQPSLVRALRALRRAADPPHR